MPNPNSLNLNVQGDLYAPSIPGARASSQVYVPLSPYTGLAAAEPCAQASRTGPPMGADEDSSDDQDEDKATPILSRLGTRGRGRYMCPYGWECNKGGVGRNQDLRVFELNSTFRFASLFQNQRVLTDTSKQLTEIIGTTFISTCDR